MAANKKIELDTNEIHSLLSGVSIQKKPRRRKYKLTKPVVVRFPEDEGLSIMEKAAIRLGSRLVEKRGRGYYLDGKPASSFTIIQEAGL